MRQLPERDWKYLRSIEKSLLDELCRRINVRGVEIVQSETSSEHQKYLALYKHVEKSDRIIPTVSTIGADRIFISK